MLTIDPRKGRTALLLLLFLAAPGCGVFDRGDRADRETAMKWFLAGGESRPTGVSAPRYDWQLGPLSIPIHSVNGPRMTLEDLREIHRQLGDRIAGLEAGYAGELVPREASAEFKAGYVAAGWFFAMPYGRPGISTPRTRSIAEPVQPAEPEARSTPEAAPEAEPVVEKVGVEL